MHDWWRSITRHAIGTTNPLTWQPIYSIDLEPLGPVDTRPIDEMQMVGRQIRMRGCVDQWEGCRRAIDRFRSRAARFYSLGNQGLPAPPPPDEIYDIREGEGERTKRKYISDPERGELQELKRKELCTLSPRCCCCSPTLFLPRFSFVACSLIS